MSKPEKRQQAVALQGAETIQNSRELEADAGPQQLIQGDSASLRLEINPPMAPSSSQNMPVVVRDAMVKR